MLPKLPRAACSVGLVAGALLVGSGCHVLSTPGAGPEFFADAGPRAGAAAAPRAASRAGNPTLAGNAPRAGAAARADAAPRSPGEPFVGDQLSAFRPQAAAATGYAARQAAFTPPAHVRGQHDAAHHAAPHAVSPAAHAARAEVEAVEGGSPLVPVVPQELQKITLPPYVLAPPDILLIDAVKLVPKAPYRIEPLDVLLINVEGTLQDQPIQTQFGVDPGGMVHLGPSYGSVKVGGLSLAEARAAIDRHLRSTLREPQVSVSLAQIAGMQQIVGEHLIGPDGTVNLGTYGKVFVAGMTIGQARAAVEHHLSAFLEAPKVSVDVFSYNSLVYYVVIEGAGQGDRVFRIPATGNETVLDAIANERVGGLTQLSSKKIWVARPAPSPNHCDQILPVDWKAITQGASTETNYQVFPGDRIFIAEDRLVAFDRMVDKLTAPFERMFGFVLVSSQAIQVTQRFPKGQQSGGGFF
jgi:polysaccharide export outer membrane protein